MIPTHVKKFMELHGYIIENGKFVKKEDSFTSNIFEEIFGENFKQANKE